MSVINSVLKNLEHKPSAFRPLDLGDIPVEVKKELHTNWWSKIIIGFIICALLVYLAFTFLSPLQKQAEEIVAPVEPAIGIPRESQPLKTAQEVIAPTEKLEKAASLSAGYEITGLQINESREFMELEFQLTGQATKFLKQRNKNQYVFQFEDTSSVILTPEMRDNPWVNRVSFKQVENSLHLQFDTQEGVLVETRDIVQNESKFWLIRFKTPQVLPPPIQPIAVNEPIVNSKKISTEKVDLDSAEDKLPHIEKEVKLDIKPIKPIVTDVQRLNEAMRLLNSGQWSQAENRLQALLGGKQDRAARLKMLELYQRQKNGKQINELLQKSLKLYPLDSEFRLLQANQLFASAQYDSIVEKFANDTSNSQLLSLVATSYQRQEQHDQAIGVFKRALKLNPLQSKLWVSLAISQQHQELQEQALNSYRMALKSGQLNVRLQSFVNQRIRQLSQ